MSQHRNEAENCLREAYKTWSIEDFELERILGSGGFGDVYFAIERKSGHRVAIKAQMKASIEEHMKEQVVAEIMINALLNHPHIIPLYTFFHDQDNIYTVMEYAPSTVFDLMTAHKFNRFPEKVAAKYVCQVSDALHYMHKRSLMHRDVKPENVLVDVYGNGKLADFGYATYSSKRKKNCKYCGTLEYMSPEMVQRLPYTYKIDNWALGVMAFELLVGRSPFYSSKRNTTRNNIINRRINFPKIINTDAKSLILRLLDINPVKRLMLSKAMTHKWIRKHYDHPSNELNI